MAFVYLGIVAAAIACLIAPAFQESSTPDGTSAIHWTMIPDDFDELGREEIERIFYDGPIFPGEGPIEDDDVGRPVDRPKDP